MDDDKRKKRVRRGESFGRTGVDRTISNSLKCPNRQKQRFEAKDNDDSSDDNDSSSATTNNNNTPPARVRFADETPMIYLCSHYDKDSTDEEKDQRKKELWYTRHDFENFLRDRISTIRLLQMVQGDAILLRERCPDVCLRGLEPYQCSSLNQELQCQRQWHQRVVLAEQSLQRRQKQEVPDRIRKLAEDLSEWARLRARQLANLDELEVQLADAEPQQRRRSLASAQLGMENLMLTHRRQEQKRRATLSLSGGGSGGGSSSSSSGTATTATTNPLGLSTRRIPVDLAILKEWNAKFLEEMRKKGAVPGTTESGNKLLSSSSILMGSSLSEKTAQSRLALQRQRNSLLGATAAGDMRHTSISGGVSVSSLGYGDEDMNSKAISTQGFRFPVRRDSLVGLRRDSLLASRAAAQNAASSALSFSLQSPAHGDGSSTPSPSNVASVVVTEACFRFPVRRDSLSNVHWT